MQVLIEKNMNDDRRQKKIRRSGSYMSMVLYMIDASANPHY